MITCWSEKDVLDLFNVCLENNSLKGNGVVVDSLRKLWGITSIVKAHPNFKGVKKIYSKGVCVFFERNDNTIIREFLYPQIEDSSVSIYWVNREDLCDENKVIDIDEDYEIDDEDLGVVENLKTDKELVVSVHSDCIDFMLDFDFSGSSMPFDNFAFCLHNIINTGIYGDGDIEDMVYSIEYMYSDYKKGNKDVDEKNALNSKFISLFRNSGNSLGSVVAMLKREGYKGSEIYKTMLSAMNDITWEE